ncbi:unnamed protein product [Ectocarpus fasciculatus]
MDVAANTLFITGQDLTIPELVHAARTPKCAVMLAPEALDRMSANRAFAEKVAARGDVVYGLTTGVGTRKNRAFERAELALFNKRMIREHATGQGEKMPEDVTRGAAIVLLNSLAAGRSNVRPSVAQQISDRLSNGATRPLAPIPVHGATGMGDVTPLAHLTMDLLGDMQPEAGEALPLIAQSSVVTAYAALAIFDAKRLLDEMLVLAVLDIEAFAANPSPYHPVVSSLRPFSGYGHVISKFNHYLKDSGLHTAPPRHLQSPLSFRCAASVLGAAYDNINFCESQISIECNAHQQNPYSFMEEDRMMPVAHFDMQAISSALDFARIALAPCLTSQTERSIKMLQASETGLTDGLEPVGDTGGHGLSEIAWPLQSMTTEAKLLVQPVSVEVGSSSQAEGIEDRMTMASLSARKLLEMTTLGFRCCSISAVIASQAVELRYSTLECLCPELRNVHDRVRRIVPFLQPGDPPPESLDALVEALRNSLLLS